MPTVLFPDNSAYQLEVTVTVSGSTMTVKAEVNKLSGSGFFTSDPKDYRVTIDGTNYDGTWTYDFRDYSSKTVTTRSKTVGTGTRNWYVRVEMQSSIGTATLSGSVTVASVPSAPTGVSFSNITPSSMRYSFTRGAANGSTITANQVQHNSSPSATGATTVTLGASTTNTTPTGLPPGAPRYFRSRTENGIGWGPWTSWASQSTLPATAPLISVAPAISGASATVTLSPPGGVSGVTSYDVEYRTGGGAATLVTTTSTTLVESGLTPGATYEWRALASIGSYDSPWSSWLAVEQPRPNTEPGDYFDGSTAPPSSSDVTYNWGGTVNNSTSYALGVEPDGWMTQAQGFIQRLTGGFAGNYFARMVVLTDQTTDGIEMGQDNASGRRSAVSVGETYYGSIYVRPSRAQRLRAVLHWIDVSAAIIGTEVGTEQLVSELEGWTRLTASGTAPFGAVAAVVRVEDVTGTGWSVWLGGQWLDADAAQITLGNLYPYFDGMTLDTPEYRYDWTGTANASTSTRTTLAVPEENPLADPDCDPVPQAPRPPQIPADCIIEVGQWRRYMLEIPESEVRLWSTTVPTFLLQTGASDERQVRIRFYPNPDGLPGDELDLSEWQAEIIITYIPANTVITLDSISQRIWASVNGGPEKSAAHLLYGTGGAPATWPELSCGIGHIVTLDTPTAAPPGNLTTRILLTQRT